MVTTIRKPLTVIATAAIVAVAPAAALVTGEDMRAASSTLDWDLDAYDALLDAHVDDGHVDYPAFAESEAFARFVEQIGALDSQALDSRELELAFYINAYNALAIEGILEGLSPSGLFGRLRFFKWRKYLVAGESISLYDLEHERLITLGDPRIHFAIVCASESCPRLSSSAYRAAEIDAQLEEAARRFVNNPAKNRFDLEAGEAEVSKIFSWYEDEFERSAGSLAAYLARYVADEEIASALADDELEIRFARYDWSLNGTPP